MGLSRSLGRSLSLIVDLSRELKKQSEEGLRGSPRQHESQWRGNKRGGSKLTLFISRKNREKKNRGKKRPRFLLIFCVRVVAPATKKKQKGLGKRIKKIKRTSKNISNQERGSSNETQQEKTHSPKPQEKPKR